MNSLGITNIPNTTAQNKNLTFEARGVLTFILSLPTNWKIRKDWIRTQCPKLGRDKLDRIWKELREAGYIEKNQIHSDDGAFSGVGWIVRADNGSEYLASFETEPNVDKPDLHEKTLQRTDLLLSTEPLEGEKTDPIKLENISVVEYFNASKTKLNSDLNLTTPRGSRPTKTILCRLNALRKEKYTTDDFKLVIDYLHQRWGRDNKMHEYFVLGSIFVPSKFDDKLIKAHEWSDSGRPTMINGEWYATSKQDDERNKQALAALKNKAGIK